jgi:hypothetical protein
MPEDAEMRARAWLPFTELPGRQIGEQMTDFPKREAGALAVAANAALTASAEGLGPAMAQLRQALRLYDDKIMVLVAARYSKK